MFQKERILSVHGLNAADIGGLSDVAYKAFAQGLDHFIDGFPAQAEKIQDAAENGQHAALVMELMNVCTTLRRLHADGLVNEFGPKLDALKGKKAQEIDQDELEAFVEKLIQRVSAFSIDVQMAGRGVGGRPAAPGAAKDKALVRKFESSGGRATVLAVDNAVLFLNTIGGFLSGSPYDVISTTSCSEALRIASENRIDAVLLDIEMPEMDGYTLAKKLKANGCRAPIVFVTAHSDREYVDKAIEAGAAGLLMKPVWQDQLIEKLDEVV